MLALYAHETTSRAGHAMTVNVPDLSNSSMYHETKEPAKDNTAELNLAVISPGLEPHGTVRSTKRARIVGVALELYYSKISLMSVGSKIEFFEFFKVWSGQDDDASKDCETQDDQESVGKDSVTKEGRIPLPWEILQPVLRILGHCLLLSFLFFNCDFPPLQLLLDCMQAGSESSDHRMCLVRYSCCASSLFLIIFTLGSA